jgi:hypothetical protein
MAHYAQLDENNIVTNVIVISNDDSLDDNGNECEEKGIKICQEATKHLKWKRTSINTRLGIHYDSATGEPSADQSKAFRLNYAIIGIKYDESIDGFIIPRPIDYKGITCNSWILNAETGSYDPPTLKVEDGMGRTWDETKGKWILGSEMEG